MAAIKIKDLEKIYDNGFKAVHGINLDIEEGEFMVFVGPSGCAKSTTLRMIAGLESASSGEIYIGDRKVNDVAPKDRGIAMVFQNYALYPQMTAYENMAFGLKMKGIHREEIHARVLDAAAKLEIEDLLDRKPKDMSGGQRQRVAVGRAIVRKPDVFLFDEPLSNLDAKLRVSMRVRITSLHKKLKAEGKPATMIYVTHDQTEAMTMGDRICVLKEGKIMQVDTPINLYNKPSNSFVATFIGSPAMNLLRATVVVDEQENVALQLADGAKLTIPECKAGKIKALSGTMVDFGIRPEDIDVVEASELQGTIKAVEQMGNEQFVYLHFGDKELVARIPPRDTDFDLDSLQHITFNLDKCHIFDAETGENLSL